MPFVTEYRPSVPNLNTILMSKWHFIENQLASAKRDLQRSSPTLVQKREIFKRRARKSKALKVIYFLSRPIGVVFGLSSLLFLQLRKSKTVCFTLMYFSFISNHQQKYRKGHAFSNPRTFLIKHLICCIFFANIPYP